MKRIIPKFVPKWVAIMLDFQRDSKEAFKSVIPVRTGRTRRSVTSKRKLNKTRLKGEIVISSRSPVIRFLDKGTKPSPGRYVPILGRRIKTGMHPGIRGTNIIDKARKDIDNIGKTSIKNINRQWKRAIKEAF